MEVSLKETSARIHATMTLILDEIDATKPDDNDLQREIANDRINRINSIITKHCRINRVDEYHIRTIGDWHYNKTKNQTK